MSALLVVSIASVVSIVSCEHCFVVSIVRCQLFRHAVLPMCLQIVCPADVHTKHTPTHVMSRYLGVSRRLSMIGTIEHSRAFHFTAILCVCVCVYVLCVRVCVSTGPGCLMRRPSHRVGGLAALSHFSSEVPDSLCRDCSARVRGDLSSPLVVGREVAAMRLASRCVCVCLCVYVRVAVPCFRADALDIAATAVLLSSPICGASRIRHTFGFRPNKK